MLDLSMTSKLIKEARRKAGMTQEQLAEKLYVTKQAVSNWERAINLPDEQVRERIETILGIKLRKEKMSATYTLPFGGGSIPSLKPLSEMKSVDEISSSVTEIINSITIDNYVHVVKKMLYFALMELISYEIYFEGHCRKVFTDEPLDWDTTASELDSLINDSDSWLLEDTDYRPNDKGILSNKIELMAFFIGGELFEDFDENGYRDGFVQQIGSYGQECGYSLLSLIPESNTDIAILFKSAIMDISDSLSSYDPTDEEESESR